MFTLEWLTAFLSIVIRSQLLTILTKIVIHYRSFSYSHWWTVSEYVYIENQGTACLQKVGCGQNRIEVIMIAEIISYVPVWFFLSLLAAVLAYWYVLITSFYIISSYFLTLFMQCGKGRCLFPRKTWKFALMMGYSVHCFNIVPPTRSYKYKRFTWRKCINVRLQ